MSTTDTAIRADLIGIIQTLMDWEYSGSITNDTFFFADLGFESIDTVVLGEAIEAHYRRRFPFVQFLADIGDHQVRDIRVGDLVTFLQVHLSHAEVSGAPRAPEGPIERGDHPSDVELP